MSFWRSKKIKSVRKVHYCEMCNAKIDIGSSCSYEVGTYEDEFNSYYLCDRCRNLLDHDKSTWLGDDNELIQFEDTLFELGIVQCPKCGKNELEDWHYKYSDKLVIKCKCTCGYEYEVDLSSENLLKKNE